MLPVSSSPIQDFYNESVIFITGATGYVGSALLEKLLRTCQNTRRIYILVRNKKEKCPEKRTSDIFSTSYFNQMKQENENYMDYIKIINGDLHDDMLGVSNSDWNILTKEVNIVFHIAATVRFDEKLKTASRLNVLGTQNIIELCKLCENLKSFVYVSTAYSNSNREEIKETFYPAPIDPIEFLEIADKNSDEELVELKPKLIKGFPNTYTFTKCLAEELVRREMQHLPACVVRPAIVMGPWIEPIRGYTSNLNGPYGLMAAIGFGLLHTMRVRPESTVEMVPLDMLINLLLAAASRNANAHCNQNDRIYNFTSGNQNRLTWGDFFMYCLGYSQVLPLNEAYWWNSFQMISNKIMVSIAQFLLHTIPALLIDCFLLLSGKKPMLMKIYNKIYKGLELLEVFTMTEWKFDDGNTLQLYTTLNDRDKQLFNFNVKDVEWDIFCFYNCRALRVYTLNDPISTIKLAQKKQSRFRRISLGFFVVGIILLYILITNLIHKIIY